MLPSTRIDNTSPGGGTAYFFRLFRLWSDGHVDTTSVEINWETYDPPCIQRPQGCPWRDIEVCPADSSGNGEVDFDDLLEVLSTWGPCGE